MNCYKHPVYFFNDISMVLFVIILLEMMFEILKSVDKDKPSRSPGRVETPNEASTAPRLPRWNRCITLNLYRAKCQYRQIQPKTGF